MENEELTRGMKVFIYVYGVLKELKSKGLVQGGIYNLSPRGEEIFQQLLDEGFEPTIEETEQAMNAIMNEEHKQEVIKQLPLN